MIRPEERRTVELMPIERLAVGGGELAAPEPLERMAPVQAQEEGVQANGSVLADDSAMVTEEELEALLKEFLTS